MSQNSSLDRWLTWPCSHKAYIYLGGIPTDSNYGTSDYRLSSNVLVFCLKVAVFRSHLSQFKVPHERFEELFTYDNRNWMYNTKVTQMLGVLPLPDCAKQSGPLSDWKLTFSMCRENHTQKTRIRLSGLPRPRKRDKGTFRTIERTDCPSKTTWQDTDGNLT